MNSDKNAPSPSKGNKSFSDSSSNHSSENVDVAPVAKGSMFPPIMRGVSTDTVGGGLMAKLSQNLKMGMTNDLQLQSPDDDPVTPGFNLTP